MSSQWLTARTLALSAVAFAALGPGAGVAVAIGHGRDAVPGEQPWMAAMNSRKDGASEPVACGAVLIAPDRALTAAHCLQDESPRRLSLAIGVDRLRVAQPVHVSAARRPIQVRAVGFASHPRFRLLPSPAAPHSPPASGAEYDVGLIMLERPITSVKPVPLATAPPQSDTPALVLGHGTSADREASTGHLRAADLVVLDDQSCVDAYGALFSRESMLCANDPVGPPFAEPCSGDSGGPLIVDGAVAGVVSWAREVKLRSCGRGDEPSAFTDVAALRDFVTSAHPVIAPYPTTSPRVTGRARVARRLSCRRGSWRGGRARFRYRWGILHRRRYTFVPLEHGGYRRSLRVRKQLAGERIICRVTAYNAGGSVTRYTRARRIRR